jgi:hypothetical protein
MGEDVIDGIRAITGIIHRVRSYFQKTVVRIHVNAHIRTIVVLAGGKLWGIYFLPLTFCNNTPTPTQEGKYPPAGWCESRTRCPKARYAWGSPCRAIGDAVDRAMSHDRIPRASRDLRMSCGHFCKTWIRSYDVCSAIHAALNAWAPLGG